MKKYLRNHDAAAYIGLSVSWLNKNRLRGDGIPFSKIGSAVVYDADDLDGFITSQRRRHTNDATSNQFKVTHDEK